MTTPTISDVLPIVERVALETARWSGMDAEDLAGDIGAALARRLDDYLIAYVEMGPAVVEGRLRAEAGRIAARERVHQQRDSGQYFYDPRYIRLFLPFWFARQDWPRGPIPEDVTPGEGWATAEAIDTAIDMTMAFPRLRAWQIRVIYARHVVCRPVGGRVDWEGVAEWCGYANAETAERSYLNATNALAIEMNTCRAQRVAEHEGPGARHAVSNARARRLIWDGGERSDTDGGMGWL